MGAKLILPKMRTTPRANPTGSTKILYRAAGAPPYTGKRSSWTPSRACAEAYLDNPGFGGHFLYRTETDASHVLDLRGQKAWRRLAEELLDDEEYVEKSQHSSAHELSSDLRGGYAYVYQTWETESAIWDALARGYDWIVYDDDYPAGCETWCYLGNDHLAVTLV
jgi:hypothetical protein